jgi:hypothetical protein
MTFITQSPSDTTNGQREQTSGAAILRARTLYSEHVRV